MFWRNHITKIAGVVLLLLAICQFAAVLLTVGVSDADFTKKDEAAKFLTDINDNQELWAFSGVFNLAVDSMLGVAAAAALYLLFRPRDRILAVFGLTFVLGGSVAFIAGDGAHIVLLFVADDFANGGAGGIAAGAVEILEIGRIMAIFSAVVIQAGLTTLALGHLAFGSLISFSPTGKGANPPRWMGWPAIIAGIAWILSWLGFVSDVGFVIFIIGGIASLVWLLLLGGWLLFMAPEDIEVAEAAAAG